MIFIATPFFKKYILPGIIFQSVVIAGGYGTGRELVEFFLNYGPGGGLMAMAVSTILWSLVCAATFEFARVFRAYDYRSFFRELLGPFWILFEICYLILLLIILAVVASSAGSILEETFGLNYYFGVIGAMLGTGILVFKGGKAIETMFSWWSFLLYGIFAFFLVLSTAQFGKDIMANISSWHVHGNWLLGGFQYSFYNLGVIPVVLFATRHIETRKEALWAGSIAGFVGIIPGLLLTLAMIGHYPAILSETVPTNFILTVLGISLFQYAYQAVLFGTLIETSSGCIHAFNDRVQSVLDQKKQRMPKWLRPAIAVTLLTIGALTAQFGLINLIARGYGSISWGFFIAFVIPVLTLGVWKISNSAKKL